MKRRELFKKALVVVGLGFLLPKSKVQARKYGRIVKCVYWSGYEKGVLKDKRYSFAAYRILPDGTVILTSIPKDKVKLTE